MRIPAHTCTDAQTHRHTDTLIEGVQQKKIQTERQKDSGTDKYGVAAISRLLKIICLFCKRDLKKRQYSVKETCNFKEHANRSQPIQRLCISVSFSLCVPSKQRHTISKGSWMKMYEFWPDLRFVLDCLYV